MADLKTVTVNKLDDKGQILKNEDGSTQTESVLERYRLELWIGNKHDVLEAEAFAYPCVCQPATGPFPERQHPLCVKFKPSAELAALLLAEAKAAVAAQTA